MKKLVTLSLAAMLLSSTAVMAQSLETFDRLDSDGDDRLAYSDLLAEWPDLTQAQFDSADIDSDDFLDMVQFEALQGVLGAPATEVAATSVITPAVDAPLFENLDSDGNDKLSFDDLLAWPGVTQQIFDSADIDSNGFLDRTQYEGLKLKMMNPDMPASGLSVGAAQPAVLPNFESLDADGDDLLAFSDIIGELPGITQEQFDSADIDDNDFLDEVEYAALA